MAFGGNTDVVARVLAVTTDNYVKKATENIMAKKVLLAAFRKKKRIHKISGGTQQQRIVRYKRSGLQPFTDMPSVSFVRVNKRLNVTIPPRGYLIAEQISLWERYLNSGPEAFVNLYGTMLDEMLDDFEFN